MRPEPESMLPADLAWQIPLTLGIVHLLLGLAVLVWPSATLAVVAVLVGLELVIGGVLRLVLAIVGRGSEARVLRGITGLLGVLAGILVVAQPLRSVEVLVVVVGAFWILWGLAEAIVALTPGASGHRGPLLVEGALAVGAGAILLLWPQPTLRVVTVIVGIGLLVVGLIATWAGWRLRDLVHEADAAVDPIDQS